MKRRKDVFKLLIFVTFFIYIGSFPTLANEYSPNHNEVTLIVKS